MPSSYLGVLQPKKQREMQDRDVVGRASGYGPDQSYRKSWQEAISGLFFLSGEARNRLAQFFS
jgi:hypothetical protein